MSDINEATIIEDSTKDLLDQLGSKTETKKPGTSSSSASSFWKIADESDFGPDPGPARNPSPNPASNDAKETPNSSTGKLTQKQKEDSAKVAFGMIAMLNDLITKPVLNYKLHKKFDAEEIDVLDRVIDKKADLLEGREAEIKSKWDRLIEKHEKKLLKVEVDEEEKKQLLAAFETYFDVTQKTIPPEWFLAFAGITFVGKRIIDISFD